MRTVSCLGVLAQFLRALGLINRTTLPRVVTIRNFVPDGCRFEIATPMEAFRVEQYGNEEKFTQLILRELLPSDVLYDIGACVGLVTVHAASKGARVVAFEPDPSYRSRLEYNLRLNKLTDVQIVEWAVSDTQGEAMLFTDGVEGWSPSFLKVGKHGSLKVHTDTIDRAIERRQIPEPDVVKLDIEGAEILALRGMRKLLGSERAPQTFFIEIHPDYLPSFDSCSAEVQSLLESFGYRKEYSDTRAAEIHCIYRRQAGN